MTAKAAAFVGCDVVAACGAAVTVSSMTAVVV